MSPGLDSKILLRIFFCTGKTLQATQVNHKKKKKKNNKNQQQRTDIQLTRVYYVPVFKEKNKFSLYTVKRLRSKIKKKLST